MSADSNQTTAPGVVGGLAEDAARFAAALIAPALKRVDVARIFARSGAAGRVSVDRVTLGRATIDRLNVEGVNATLEAGRTLLEDFRMILRITIGIRFRVFGIGRERSVTLGFPVDVGDVAIPRLENIAVEVPSAVVAGTRVDIHPVDDLDLGSARFEALSIESTALPAAGFALDGIELGEVRVEGVEVTATYTEGVSIGSFAPDRPLRLPGTVVSDIQLPLVEVPRVSSSAPIAVRNITPPERSATVDLILLSITLFVRPTVDVQIAALTINDIDATSRINRITLENISSPVTITGLRLGELELREVQVNQVVV